MQNLDRATLPSGGALARAQLLFTCSLMGLLFLLPVSNNELKFAAFAIVFATATVSAIATQSHPLFERAHLSVALLFVCIGVVFGLFGLIRDNPGALFASAIYVVWPLVYQWILLPLRIDGLVQILRVLIWSTIVSGLIVLAFTAAEYGVLSWPWIQDIYPDMAIVEHEGVVQMRFYAISTMVFAVPFLIGTMVVPRKLGNPIGSTAVRVSALCLGTLVALLSGRRALWLAIAVAPAIAFALYYITLRDADGRRRMLLLAIKWSSIGGVLLACVLLYFFDSWLSEAVSFIGEALSPDAFSDGQIRFEQSTVLLNGWMQSPLFGNGLGAVAEELVRDEERPWQYELQYHLLLFSTGLFGFLAYGAGVAWILRTGLRAVAADPFRAPVDIPCMTGMACFLLANATNPYLQAFGHLWTIFLPYAVIVSGHRGGPLVGNVWKP